MASFLCKECEKRIVLKSKGRRHITREHGTWLEYLSVMLRFEFPFKRKDRYSNMDLAGDIEHVIFVQKISVLKFGLIIM